MADKPYSRASSHKLNAALDFDLDLPHPSAYPIAANPVVKLGASGSTGRTVA